MFVYRAVRSGVAPACEAQQAHCGGTPCLGPLQQRPCQASIGLPAQMLLQYAERLLS